MSLWQQAENPARAAEVLHAELDKSAFVRRSLVPTSEVHVSWLTYMHKPNFLGECPMDCSPD